MATSCDNFDDDHGQASCECVSDDVSCLTDYSSLPLCDIEEPESNDVILSLNGKECNCRGNQRFHRLTSDYRELYKQALKEEDKAMVAAEIVRAWRSLEPTGRFLRQKKSSALWDDVGDEEARVWAIVRLNRSLQADILDDATVSTACSSSFHHPGPIERTSKVDTAHGIGDCFGGPLRLAFLALFSFGGRDKDSILQQYLP